MKTNEKLILQNIESKIYKLINAKNNPDKIYIFPLHSRIDIMLSHIAAILTTYT